MFTRTHRTNPKIANGSSTRLAKHRAGPTRAMSQSFLSTVLVSGERAMKVDTVILEVTMRGQVRMQLRRSRNLPIEDSILGEYFNDDLLSIIWNIKQRGSV